MNDTNNMILDEDDELVYPLLNSESIVLDLPLDNIIQLITDAEIIKIPVHKITLYFLRKSLKDCGIDINSDVDIERFVLAIESVLSPSDVIELHCKQELCFKSGNKFIISQGTLMPSTNSLKVLVPKIHPSISVEVLDKEIPLEELKSLNQVREEYLSESFGLKKILKTEAVAEILNIIQEEPEDKEFKFYLTILDKFSFSSGTKQYILNILRLCMQYALNVDTLELKSILTKEMIDYE